MLGLVLAAADAKKSYPIITRKGVRVRLDRLSLSESWYARCLEVEGGVLLRYMVGCFQSRSSVSGQRVGHALISDHYHSLFSSPL